MQYALEQFIDEAIQLELNAAEIYYIFAAAIPEDANFWATLAWEEKNHASVLKTGKEILIPMDKFPPEILPNVIQTIVDTNLWLNSLKEKFAENKPDRETAFATAIKIESSAGEQHFQRVMENPSDSTIVKILQELCEDDINHLSRIREYMKSGSKLGKISESETKNILIVVNDDAVAKLLQTILEPEGQIDIAGNGREGLQKVKEQDYGLIVSAIEMPIVDGIQFYNEAKGLYPDVHEKFLFFIGAPSLKRVSFFQNENLKYLVKPSTISEIRAAALGVLEKRQ
jgi:CheY-like chemotaxis protein/rubrerythrin